MTHRMLSVALLGAAWCASSSAAAQAAAPADAVSEVLKVKRPAGGEYFGVYLLNKKVGYLYSDLALEPGSKDRVRLYQEFYIRANVGGKESNRSLKETRIFESKPGGHLLSFVVEQKGDGGDQTLEATSTPAGLTVVRKRPGFPNQVLNLPPAKDRVEDADQVRVALLRRQKVEGMVTDSMDLQPYKLVTTVEKAEDRLVGGVKVRLHKLVNYSEKEKVNGEFYLTDKGDVMEVDFGQNMTWRAEPESVAKNLEKVEVFSLTRLTMPKKLPLNARAIPGGLTLVLSGLPSHFWHNDYRQHFKKLTDATVEVTISVAPPKGKHSAFPLRDPDGGNNLKSDIIIESDNPEIVSRARRIVGTEKDAYAAAKKIVEWVGKNMSKDYGVSSDRATDVLRTMKGDCTEHSLLAESLLRAVGIPAHRVDGVVYVVQEDGVPAMYWHEWVEAYVGEWTQLDPTFGESVADATHFEVGQEANAEIIPLIGQMKVLDDRSTVPQGTVLPN